MKKFLLITVCLALIFFFSLRIKGDLQMYRLLTDESKDLKQTKSSLTKEKEKLEQLLEEGKGEEVLEQTARLMLGLKKEGEDVIMVLPPKILLILKFKLALLLSLKNLLIPFFLRLFRFGII